MTYAILNSTTGQVEQYVEDDQLDAVMANLEAAAVKDKGEEVAYEAVDADEVITTAPELEVAPLEIPDGD